MHPHRAGHYESPEETVANLALNPPDVVPGAVLVDHQVSAAFVRGQATFLYVIAIPGGGTTLTLPANPENGEQYAFASDNSESIVTSLTINAGANFIRGAHTFVSTTPFQWGILTFVAANDTWALQQGS